MKMEHRALLAIYCLHRCLLAYNHAQEKDCARVGLTDSSIARHSDRPTPAIFPGSLPCCRGRKWLPELSTRYNLSAKLSIVTSLSI
ncbi:hypothetical protein BJX61DRAFT_506016 [Aspergillus egyptiacus]|nr:hypothetical protein BJX61DRAFT_506016 [Aspergillus egyptiacus]